MKPNVFSTQFKHHDQPESFLIMHLIDKKGKDYIVESAAVPKRSYDDWFWEKASAVPVAISNPWLRAEFLKQVSWAGNLNLK
jgi:hypothetical protein